MSKMITPEEVKKVLKENEDVLILDVRRKSDYEADSKSVAGAVWRDPENVDEWSKEIPTDKDVVIYCVRGGSVSKSVSDRLAQEDIQVSYIEGGITAWKEAGGEIQDK